MTKQEFGKALEEEEKRFDALLKDAVISLRQMRPFNSALADRMCYDLLMKHGPSMEHDDVAPYIATIDAELE